MKNRGLVVLAWAVLFPAYVSATTVELSADKDVVWIGQKIEITLKLHSESKITGQLTVVNLDEKKQEKVLFQSVSPGCTCRADKRITGDFTDTSTFTPMKLGNYQVRAYFDGIEKTLNFTVKSRLEEQPTTTSTTTTSPMVASTSTSNPYVAVAGAGDLLAASSTTSTTAAAGPMEDEEHVKPSFTDRCPCESAPALIGGVLIVTVLVDAVYRYFRRVKQ